MGRRWSHANAGRASGPWWNALAEIFYRDSSLDEAAETLGVPAGTVKSRTYYGLRAMREALVERGHLPPSTVDSKAEPGAKEPAAEQE
jgi:RNA polymerase sigma-70 factor (ECF subfamily)